jgi:diguanylate cyclase (GGDEF)-like protein
VVSIAMCRRTTVRWKASALLVGAAVLLTALSSWVARRSDTRDERQQALEVAASVAAVRIDAAVHRASTTLSLAGAELDAERLADAIGVPVCHRGIRPECATPGVPASPVSADGFGDPATERAEALAAAASRDAGRPGVAVVAARSRSAGTAIVVAVQHPDGRTVALLPLEPGLVVPDAMTQSSADAVSTPLTTEFANGPWSTLAVPEDGISPTAGLTWVTAVQIVVGAAITVAAVAAMAHDQRRLSRRATTDSLTGLPNRAEFERRASRRLTQLDRDGGGACLIVVDLDGFKAINDLGGHAAGDRVLAEAGRRLAAAVRSTDLVGRWGGDEFVLLLAGISDPLAIPDRAAAIAACLRDLPADPTTRLTASVGAAAFPVQGRDLATLLDLADSAMYEVKRRPPASQDGSRSGGDPAPAVPWRP